MRIYVPGKSQPRAARRRLTRLRAAREILSEECSQRRTGPSFASRESCVQPSETMTQVIGACGGAANFGGIDVVSAPPGTRALAAGDGPILLSGAVGPGLTSVWAA